MDPLAPWIHKSHKVGNPLLKLIRTLLLISGYWIPYWESVAGSVIQATETVEFEDGLWIGNHLKA